MVTTYYYCLRGLGRNNNCLRFGGLHNVSSLLVTAHGMLHHVGHHHHLVGHEHLGIVHVLRHAVTELHTLRSELLGLHRRCHERVLSSVGVVRTCFNSLHGKSLAVSTLGLFFLCDSFAPLAHFDLVLGTELSLFLRVFGLLIECKILPRN